MKHITILLFASIIILTNNYKSFAQWGMGKPEDIAAIKTRKLIVVLETPDQKIIDKLTKKGKANYIDYYRQAVNDYNDHLKDAMSKFWTFSQKIEYKTNDEVMALVKSKSRDYMVLRCASTDGNLYNLNAQSDLFWTYKNVTNNSLAAGTATHYIFNSSVLEISLIEKEDTYYPIYYVELQDIFPVESDIIYGLRNLQYYLTIREHNLKESQMKDEAKARTPLLKDKILVVRKDILDSTLTLETIKSLYPYKFEVDDSATFEQHVINADDGYAVLENIPSYSGSIYKPIVIYNFSVMDTKSGESLGTIGAPPGSDHTVYIAIGSPVADKRIFKILAERIAGGK